MDNLALSLSSNTTVSDVKLNVIKIIVDCIAKLNLNSHYNDLTHNDIEFLVKSAFYVDECFMHFKKYLKNVLIEDYPLYRKAIEIVLKSPPDARNATRYVCNFILNHEYHPSKDDGGVDTNRFILECLLNSLPEGYNNILSTIASSPNDFELYDEENTASRSKEHSHMVELIDKIFSLPKHEIKKAFDRMLLLVDFDVVGLILCEPPESQYIDNCLIASQWICSKFAQSVIPHEFVDSICIAISDSRKGKNLFLKCLENQIFMESFLKFLMDFLHNLNEDIKANLPIDLYSKYSLCRNYNISHVLFLLWSSLHIRSPCRIYYYRKLSNYLVSTAAIDIINKMNFIYD